MAGVKLPLLFGRCWGPYFCLFDAICNHLWLLKASINGYLTKHAAFACRFQGGEEPNVAKSPKKPSTPYAVRISKSPRWRRAQRSQASHIQIEQALVAPWLNEVSVRVVSNFKDGCFGVFGIRNSRGIPQGGTPRGIPAATISNFCIFW